MFELLGLGSWVLWLFLSFWGLGFGFSEALFVWFWVSGFIFQGLGQFRVQGPSMRTGFRARDLSGI